MTRSSQTLIDYFNNSFILLDKINPETLASIYTNSVMLSCSVDFISEEVWLSNQKYSKPNKRKSYDKIITPLFENILNSVTCFQHFMLASGVNELMHIKRKCDLLTLLVLNEIKIRSAGSLKVFLVHSLKHMMLLFVKEEALKEKNLGNDEEKIRGPRLYRVFDGLDDLFELDYEAEKNVENNSLSLERLYTGSGVGVQSGYSTILLALNELKLQKGNQIIDLGSGYGRVGLVCALLWPQVKFVGYEFVAHRVINANESCQLLKLEDNLSFITQDLSLNSFKVPEVDIYYFYDPFTDDTYKYILNQIVRLSEKKKIKIVSKGNSGQRFLELAKLHSWPTPLILDEGNLYIFST